MLAIYVPIYKLLFFGNGLEMITENVIDKSFLEFPLYSWEGKNGVWCKWRCSIIWAFSRKNVEHLINKAQEFQQSTQVQKNLG